MEGVLIESTSPGHERHDRAIKRQWYALARVPNYWILDAYGRSLECLALGDDGYRLDAMGRDQDEIRPSLFAGLIVRLGELWP